MRHALVLGLLVFGCSPSAPGDAGTDAGASIEVFAALGARGEGIAVGRSQGAPALFAGTADDRVVRIAPGGVVAHFVELHAPLGIAAREDEHLVVCARRDEADGEAPALFLVTPEGEASVLLERGPDGEPFGLTNFVAIAPDGSLVFTDSAADRVYRADADGANVALVTDAISYPNGLAFSPDGATLYVASWDGDAVYALAFDAASSSYGEPAVSIEGVASVDGLVSTSDGGLVLVTSTRGILLGRPGTNDTTPLVGPRELTLPANAVFGEPAFGVHNLYVASLGEDEIVRVTTALRAP